jgi:hypothetical protein
MQGAGLEEAGAASTGEEAGLEPWEKIVNFAKDEWFPSRLLFGKGDLW